MTTDSVLTSVPPINVLITLHRGYGLGDAVQQSAVLRHVAKYRPHWVADLRAEPGRHCIGCGIVANTFAFGEPFPHDHYDCEVEILLYDTWSNFHDRPNTRVSSCLHERFGMGWDLECGRYQIHVSPEARNAARVLLKGGFRDKEKLYKFGPRFTRELVAVHYEGDSSQQHKNLTHVQAAEICSAIEDLGYGPAILDWRGRSPIQGHRKIVAPQKWGGDAEMVCAVISQCAAFVGIDSGPSKCASATDIPALVVWTGHHPAPFHDPAPNTTHLVPAGYHGLEPVCDDPGVIRWFESHYNVRTYKTDPVGEVKAWLKEMLK